MRKKIVAGNWKMNTTPAEGVELFKGVAAKKGEVCSCVNFIVAPPFTHLSEIVKAARGTGIAVSAQNCAAEAKGAYTGEVSAKMIASLGVEYVILGHSERREYYGETSQTLNKKMAQAYENNLAPIYCVGEKLEDREAGKHFDVVRAQIEEVVYNLTPEQFSKLIVAYEPVWAIGTGKTATADQAQEMHAFIRQVLAEKFGSAADQTVILYGGRRRPDRRRGARGRRLHRDRQGIQVSRSIYRIRPELDGLRPFFIVYTQQYPFSYFRHFRILCPKFPLPEKIRQKPNRTRILRSQAATGEYRNPGQACLVHRRIRPPFYTPEAKPILLVSESPPRRGIRRHGLRPGTVPPPATIRAGHGILNGRSTAARPRLHDDAGNRTVPLPCNDKIRRPLLRQTTAHPLPTRHSFALRSADRMKRHSPHGCGPLRPVRQSGGRLPP